MSGARQAYQAIADAFVDEGVDTVFALMGDGNMMVLADLVSRHSVRVVNVRHENAAVAMADGWARTTGRVGVASVTCGPGLTQVSTALTAAVRNRTPLVVFSGDVPSTMAWNPQQHDASAVVGSTGARFVPLRSADRLYDAIRTAFYLATDECTGVVLSIPYDVQERPLTDSTVYRPSSTLRRSRPIAAAQPDQVEIAADLLEQAERPLVLAGAGAVGQRSRAEVLRLADRIGAILGTTLKANCLFVDEPWNVGIVGGLSSATTLELLREVDVVVAVGASLGYFTTDNGRLLSGKSVVRIDRSPHGVNEGVAFEETVLIADSALGAGAVADELDRRGHRNTGLRTPETQRLLATPSVDLPSIEPESGTVDPDLVMHLLDDLLPSELPIVLGVGHFWSFAAMRLHRARPDLFTYAYGFGAVGHGLPTAIGVAVALGRPLVLVEGDGSLLMHVGELLTLALEQLPVLVVVLNDGGYGSEIHKLHAKGAEGELARFGRTDVAALGRAFGLDSHRLTDVDDLTSIVRDFLDEPKPTLIDVPMSKSAISAPTRRALFPKTLPGGQPHSEGK